MSAMSSRVASAEKPGSERLELGDEAVHHLQALLRIDTTNPPGNETPAAEYLAELFHGAGLEPTLIGEMPERKNVIARPAAAAASRPCL
jgi:acetylornithine deacetylase/succinyl-diaminopimelate desuccinylase-like protein